MDKAISTIASLGVPGLVLLVAIGATGLSGAAAITAALAAIGPAGMIGGIITLGVTGVVVYAITEFGFDAVFKAVVDELVKEGYEIDEIKYKIKNDIMYKFVSNSLKLKLIGYLDKYVEAI